MKNDTMRRYGWSLLWICLMAWSQPGRCQTIIFTGYPSLPGPAYLFQVDLATCTYCPIFEIPLLGDASETLVLPNGNVAISYPTLGTFIYDLPNTAPVATFPAPGWAGAIIHPNGTIYVATNGGYSLSTLNPVTNTLTTIGNFPAGVDMDELFFVGNTLYGFGYQGPGTRPVYEINVTNPAASVQVYPFSAGIGGATTTPGGQTITSWPGGGAIGASDFNLYNLTTNSWTPICQTPILLVRAISSLPAGAPVPDCVCLSIAGTPVSPTANACVPNAYTANFNNDLTVFPGDGVGYILYTDPSNPAGSVLFQNSTGIFPYVPPLLPNVVYYVSRVVGSVVNGQVNLTSACLGVSPPIAVTWRPRPTLISVSSSNNNLCTGGCTEITVNFTGTPPMYVYGQLFQNGSAVTPLDVNVALSNGGSYTVCVPPNVPPGATQYTICGLLDQYCTN